MTLTREPEFRVLFHPAPEGARAEVLGEVTIDSSPELRAALLESLAASNCRRLEVDLRGVLYIDTSGAAVLVEVLRSARQLGKRVALSGLQERARYLFESTGLLRLFDEAVPDPSV